MPDFVTTAALQASNFDVSAMIAPGGQLDIEAGATPQAASGSFNDSLGDADGIWTFNERIIDTDGSPGSPVASADPSFTFSDAVYAGYVSHGGFDYPIIYNGLTDTHWIVFNDNTGVTGMQAATSFQAAVGSSAFNTNGGTTTECFAEGTLIATPAGEVAVETLKIGAMVTTAEGCDVPVKWLGQQTRHKLFSGTHMQPVRIHAGALGDGLPHSDLTVTADHGMILDGHVINASALVNGTTIDWVPMAELPDTFTVYHVETQAHDVILANGAAAETFIDYADRRAFDNFDEYLDLYGCERLIPEMAQPRISAARHLPLDLRRRLGLTLAA